MPALPNGKHERFAQALAKGRSQAEAYVEASYKASEPHASRLASSGKVQARVAELQERAAIKVEVTVADIAAQLDEDRMLAHREGQAGAAVSASLGKAKVLGLIIDRTVTTITDKRAEELSEEELLGIAAGSRSGDPSPPSGPH